jgi:hypothetical protein
VPQIPSRCRTGDPPRSKREPTAGQQSPNAIHGGNVTEGARWRAPSAASQSPTASIATTWSHPRQRMKEPDVKPEATPLPT